MHVHYTAHGKNGARRADCRRLHLHRLTKRISWCTADAPCKAPPSWLEKGRTCGYYPVRAPKGSLSVGAHHMRVWYGDA